MFLFVISIVYAVIGFFMLNFPPKKINMIYGWRTPSATKDIRHWNFANHYGGKLFLWGALVMLLLQGVMFILGSNKVLTMNQSKTVEGIIVFASIVVILVIGEIKIRNI